MRALPHSRRQSGIALLAMLILSTIVMITMAGIFYRHQMDIAAARQVFTTEQASLLALSGESWGKRLLQQDQRGADVDSLEDDWARSMPPMPVEGGTLTGCIIDLQGRFNLNNLSGYDSESWREALGDMATSYVEAYLNLLALNDLESDDSRAAVVVDWIDADNELIAGFSAEDADYLAGETSGLAANRMLSSVDEVGALAGYSAAEIAPIKAYLSALPAVTPINVNTASAQLLTALIPLVNDAVIEELVASRPFRDKQAFFRFLDQAVGHLGMDDIRTHLSGDLISVNSDFFAMVAEVELDGVRMRLTSRIYRPDGARPQVFSRSFESLPAVEVDDELAERLRSPCRDREMMHGV